MKSAEPCCPLEGHFILDFLGHVAADGDGLPLIRRRQQRGQLHLAQVLGLVHHDMGVFRQSRLLSLALPQAQHYPRIGKIHLLAFQ